MIITSKVGLYKEDIFHPDPRRPNSHGLSRKHILDAVEASLKRLQTDYIDLYQVTYLYHSILRDFHDFSFEVLVTGGWIHVDLPMHRPFLSYILSLL